jgi:hypothetical protein
MKELKVSYHLFPLFSCNSYVPDYICISLSKTKCDGTQLKSGWQLYQGLNTVTSVYTRTASQSKIAKCMEL